MQPTPQAVMVLFVNDLSSNLISVFSLIVMPIIISVTILFFGFNYLKQKIIFNNKTRGMSRSERNFYGAGIEAGFDMDKPPKPWKTIGSGKNKLTYK